MKAQAVSALSNLNLRPEDKIVHGKTFGVKKWTEEGYRALAAKETLLAEDDLQRIAMALGWETTARIWWLRERNPCSPLPPIVDEWGRVVPEVSGFW